MHDALCCSKESRDSAAREEQRTKMQTMLATAQEATQAQHGVAAICKPAVDSWPPEASLKQKVSQLMSALQESEALASRVELLPMEERLSQASTAEAAAQVQESAVALSMLPSSAKCVACIDVWQGPPASSWLMWCTCFCIHQCPPTSISAFTDSEAIIIDSSVCQLCILAQLELFGSRPGFGRPGGSVRVQTRTS